MMTKIGNVAGLLTSLKRGLGVSWEIPIISFIPMMDASTNSLTNTEKPHFQTGIGLNKAQTQLLSNEGKIKLCSKPNKFLTHITFSRKKCRF